MQVYLDSIQSGDNGFLFDARLSRSSYDNPELFWSTLEAGTSLTRVVIDGFPLNNIALALVRFPAGTTGSQLDALARAALWASSLAPPGRCSAALPLPPAVLPAGTRHLCHSTSLCT
jgi:hypothetical protein